MGRFDKELTEIDGLKEKLAAMCPLRKEALQRLLEDFMIESTYNSNAIEGSTLTLQETALIIQEGMTIAGKSMREHLEVIGHKDAFDFIVSLADEKEPLTDRRIKEIHSLILIDNASYRGRYRDVPVMIRGALYHPPQPYLIEPQMEALMTAYEAMKRDKHIIEAIAEFHLRFEGIHPFIDGNGRTGRLIINLELIKAGYLPVDIKFASRDRYYACFHTFFDSDKSPDLLTELIIGYEIQELKRYIEIVEYANSVRKED